MPLEKNCRVNHDAASLSRVLVAIVEICYNKKAWKELNENIAALTKVTLLFEIFKQGPFYVCPKSIRFKISAAGIH